MTIKINFLIVVLIIIELTKSNSVEFENVNLYNPKNEKYLSLLQNSVQVLSNNTFQKQKQQNSYILMDVVNSTLFRYIEKISFEVVSVDAIIQSTANEKSLQLVNFKYTIYPSHTSSETSFSNSISNTTPKNERDRYSLDLNLLFSTFLEKGLNSKQVYRYLGGDLACYKVIASSDSYFINGSIKNVTIPRIMLTCGLKELKSNHTISLGFHANGIENKQFEIKEFTNFYLIDTENSSFRGFNLSHDWNAHKGEFFENEDRNKVAALSYKYLKDNNLLLPSKPIDPNDDNTPDERINTQGNKRYWWILLVIVVIIALIIGGYFAVKFYRKKLKLDSAKTSVSDYEKLEK